GDGFLALLNADQVRKSQFAGVGVGGAMRAATTVSMEVEQVVRDLESQPEILAVGLQRRVLLFTRAADESSKTQAGQKQGSGLSIVNRFEQLTRTGRQMFGQIVALTANELRRTGGVRQCHDALNCHFRRRDFTRQ